MNISNIPVEGKCTGCRACEQACNFHAIEMNYNEFGFISPTVSDLCTQCGCCVTACQACSEKKDFFNEVETAYIAYAKDKKRAYLSASGGAFVVIAEKIINEYNGIVYGCCMDEEFNVFHTKASEVSELWKFQGSKYVQSDTKKTYTSVRKELQEGRKVLYTGTPCQIAGLKAFLKREWDNLYTVDLICHGVPSQLALKKYLKWLENGIGSKILSFRFRNRNAYDASGYLIKMTLDNGKVIKNNALNDLFFRMFSRNKSLNNACCNCKYAQAKRVGDITIGDSAAAGILGLYRYEPKSTIMLNTKKGREIWDLIKGELAYTEIDKELEVQRNKPLSRPSTFSNDRDDVCKLMVEGKFDELNNRYPSEEKSGFDVHKISAKIPMFVKKPLYSGLCFVRKLRGAK